jgi:uroporphyrinogen-III synthase
LNDLSPVLTGCRILVTAQRRAGELSAALSRRGAEVVNVPTLGVVPHIDEQGLLARTRDILASSVDTLVVTTAIGFSGWLDTAETAGLAEELLEVLGGVRLVARGPKAHGALQAAGLRADWVAESETSAEIADFLTTEGVHGHRIAVQHHGAGDDGLDERLTDAGAFVVPLEVYRWGPPPDAAAVADSVHALVAGCFDAVVFTSAPAASAWLRELARLDATDAVRGLATGGRLLVAAVGPVTSEPLTVAVMRPVLPDRARMGALVRKVIMDLGDPSHGIETPGGLLHLRASGATLDHAVLPISPSGLAVLRRLAATPGQVVTRD